MVPSSIPFGILTEIPVGPWIAYRLKDKGARVTKATARVMILALALPQRIRNPCTRAAPVLVSGIVSTEIVSLNTRLYPSFSLPVSFIYPLLCSVRFHQVPVILGHLVP